MSAKNLIDGVRRDFAIPLGLNRSRDVIARLIYGSPYSATLAAEKDGKLNPPALVDDRTASMASAYGSWIRDLAEIARIHIAAAASPFDFLSLEDLLALTKLSAKRDTEGFIFYEPSAVTVEPPAWVEELSTQLEDQLVCLDPESIIELSALVTLGRAGDGDYVRLVGQARANRSYGNLSAWLSAMPIHRYAAKGLAKLGQAGLAILVRHPELSDWLIDPPPAEPEPVEVSLVAIAQLEQELEELATKARLPKPFESYVRSTYRRLDRVDDLDYFGCDEQMPYLTVGFAKRQYALICICGDLEIGKAYYHAGDVSSAATRIRHARNFIFDLHRTIETGARVAGYASAGGQAKAAKLGPLKREFMRLLEVKRPAGGWRSMERTAAALADPMMRANDALESGPVLSGSLESTLVAWLSKDAEVREVYLRNRSAKA